MIQFLIKQIIHSFRGSGRKMAERFQKVTTSQEHQTIYNAVLFCLFSLFCFILNTKKTTKFAVKNCNSAKTFTAYLSVYELANYSSAKTFDIFFARLLDRPVF